MTALMRSTVTNIAWFGTGTALTAIGLALWAGLGGGYVVLACAIYAAMTAFTLRHLEDHHPRATFGRANQVTLFRVGLIALVGGTLAVVAPPPWLQWLSVSVASVALALDGVDGLLARRRGSATRLGARFDLEVDAALILLLAALAWQTGKVGAWVLLIGLWRYVFVLAGVVFPKLRGPLGPALWRKAVCVLQIVSLLFVLLPVSGAIAASTVAAIALAALTASFAYDAWRMTTAGDVPFAAGNVTKP
ncbi:CDP-alcohol phosphatidyltransferase family protein [Marinivivus vitaminiproducens]|uniref:CDP-alcohol phosphatidyltransferase family protein n=1 Tax=Marinivivus vitaminiproducens TaxID=3035935 RepID=UPI0027AA05D1|nr:CDP-alcohol phosphatidyltransferase family protein [Geminicoccaceae bacterium SCSIO 64248]